MSVYYHGTTLSNLKEIIVNGFFEQSYFTTSIDDAVEYAVMGGESSLQCREEDYENEHGITAREDFLDMWDMYHELFPDNEQPVVIEVRDELHGIEDSGAENALCVQAPFKPSNTQVYLYDWENDSLTDLNL